MPISQGPEKITIVMRDPPGDIKKILGPKEQVSVYITQKIYHPKINMDSVAVTNERIILRHPHALGLKKDYTDFNYQDISNVVLEKGITRSTIKATLRLGGEPLTLDDLPNSEAEKAYVVIRENVARFQAPLSAGYAGVQGTRQGLAPAVAPAAAAVPVRSSS